MNPGRLEFTGDFDVAYPAGLHVGDEVVILGRGIVKGLELDLVDVRAYQTRREVIPGSSVVKVSLTDVAIVDGRDGAQSPRSIVEALDGIGVEL